MTKSPRKNGGITPEKDAARYHRARILLSFVALCRKLEQARGATPGARRACREVAAALRKLLPAQPKPRSGRTR